MTIHAFKITRTDGTTHGGYRWPLPMTGEQVRVDATRPTEHGDVCPRFDGDGLCVALSAFGASSGGIGLASCIGLLVDVDEADVLASDEHKMRVRSVTVTGIFDVLALIHSGICANLVGANLVGADLRHVDLRHADLTHANLGHADLRRADLRRADLTHANLWHANLGHADLRHANLWGANLGHAYGRDDWGALVELGAIR